MPCRRKTQRKNARAEKHGSTFLYMDHDAGRSTCSAHEDEQPLDILDIVGTPAEHNGVYPNRSAAQHILYAAADAAYSARLAREYASHKASESSRKEAPIHNVVAGNNVYSSHIASESSRKEPPIHNVEAGTAVRSSHIASESSCRGISDS